MRRSGKWNARRNHQEKDGKETTSIGKMPLTPRLFIYQQGGVKVSTGILRYSKRVEPSKLLKLLNLKINANDNLAYAA